MGEVVNVRLGNFEVFGIMRTWLLVVAAVLLPTFGSSASYSIRNPAVRNPVGVSRAPVSGIRGGLFATPSPMDTASDLAITGNLRGGKYFRGNVPYRATTDFGLDPGTQSLNSSKTAPSLRSFLRDATGPQDLGRRSSRYGTRPYYFPGETVATTVPGRQRVFRPADTRMLGDAQRGRSIPTHLFALEPSSSQQIAPGQGFATDYADLRGLRTRNDLPIDSLSISDGTFIGDTSPGLRVGRLTPGEVAIRRQDEELASERFRGQAMQSLLDARRESRFEDRQTLDGDMQLGLEARTRAQSPADARDAAVARYRLSPLETSNPFEDTVLRQDGAEFQRAIRPEQPITPGLKSGVQGSFLSSQAEGRTAAPGSEQDDVMERIRRHLDDLAKSVESRMQAEPGGSGQIGSVVPVQETYELRPATQPYKSGVGEAFRSYDPGGGEPGAGEETLAPAGVNGVFGKVDYRRQTGLGTSQRPSLAVSRKMTSLPRKFSALSSAQMSGEAKRIIGSRQSLDSFSGDKFNRHVEAAEDYLGAGKYYKAADSFALALMYEPDNVQALAGRSHALFAAGEYVSSALFLSRALAIRPDYANSRIDLATLLGGRSRLAGRIADVEQWFARSGSPKLQLLLGYVYLQTGRLNEASKAIKAAHKRMPQSPAIPAIKAAIDAAAAR